MFRIEYKEGSFKKEWRDLYPLLHKHFEELPLVGLEHKPFYLDIQMLLDFENMGYLVCVGAYKKEKVIGYMCIVLSPHIFFKGTMTAQTVCFYVSPEYRRSKLHRVGYRLLKKTEKILKENYGVEWLDLIMNCNFNFEKWADKLGYQKTDIVFRRVL